MPRRIPQVQQVLQLGGVSIQQEIEQAFLLTRVIYKAVLGLHYRRKEQRHTGQLAIF